jgi:hypothetical protein
MLSHFKNKGCKQFVCLEVFNLSSCNDIEEEINLCGFIINLKLPDDMKERIFIIGATNI